MKALMLLSAVAGIGGAMALAVAGVFRVRNTGESLDITIDKKKLKRKARKAAERTRQASRKAVDTARDAMARVQGRLENGRSTIRSRTGASSGNGRDR
jgi:hypothetical protein